MPKKKDEVAADGGDFDRIVGIIEKAKERAYSAVNKELLPEQKAADGKTEGNYGFDAGDEGLNRTKFSCVIKPYGPEYRDDMLFCYLSAKNALGGVPRLREDLLDIAGCYFDCGDMFWVAVDTNGRVAGMVGTKTVTSADMWLKRLFIRPDMKRRGIASGLLAAAEEFARVKGIKTLHTRFGDNYLEAAEFYPAKGFAEVGRSEGLRHWVKDVGE